MRREAGAERGRRVGVSLRRLAAAALAGWALSGVAAGGVGSAAAQESPRLHPGTTGDASSFTGFWGVPWGADSARVVEELGPPIVAGKRDGRRAFSYTVFHLGRDGFLEMWLDGEEGLVGGAYEPVVDDCTDMLRRMVREIRRRHPEIEPRTYGRVAEGGLRRDLCASAVAREAAIEVVWEDGGGHQVRLGSAPGRPALRLTVLAAPIARPPEGER